MSNSGSVLTWLPLISVLLPGVIGLIYWNARTDSQRYVISGLGPWIIVLPVVAGFRFVQGEYHLETVLGQVAPGIEFGLQFDPLGWFFTLFLTVLFAFGIPYCEAYCTRIEFPQQARIIFSLFLIEGIAIGIFLATDLFSVFVLFQILALLVYGIVSTVGTADARRAGYTLLAYILVASLFLLSGIRLLRFLTGSSAFVSNGIPTIQSAIHTEPVLGLASFWLLFFGFGIAAAIVPVHSWVIDLLIIPVPIAGLLGGVVILKVGVFGIFRITLDIFGAEVIDTLGITLPVFILLGVSMMLTHLLAISQNVVEYRLLYAIIATNMIPVLGVFVLTPLAIQGSLYYILSHAVVTAFLFIAVPIVSGVGPKPSQVAHRGHDSQRAFVFALGVLGLAAVPLFGTFVGLWYLMLGTIATHPILLGVLIGSNIFVIAYFAPVIATCVAGTNNLDVFRAKDLSWISEPISLDDSLLSGDNRLIVAILGVFLISLLLGIFPDYLQTLPLTEFVIEQIWSGYNE